MTQASTLGMPWSKTVFCGVTFSVFFIWFIIRTIYNVFFHPLSKFPGPKLAGATRWYEAFFDLLVSPGGQYMNQIDRIHEQHGPIVRIAPNELHVRDVNFHATLYALGVKRNKVPYMIDIFGTKQAIFGTEEHDLHKTRRIALNPFFSKRSVARLESVIQSKVRRMCNRVSEYRDRGNILELYHAFTATIVDITTEYSFAKCADALDDPNFSPEWDQMMRGVSEIVPLARSFPGIVQIAQALPISAVEMLNPLTAKFLKFERLVRFQVEEIFARYRSSKAEFSSEATESKNFHDPDKEPTNPPRSIFHEILNSSMPEHEKTVDRMTQEALSIISAASETTSSVLATTIFHILENPDIHRRLIQELEAAMPDSVKELKDWRTLEALPYLSATIKEGLRLTVPICSRLPLYSPTQPLTYTAPSASPTTTNTPKTYIIPAGTYVGMSPRDLLYDPEIYLSPHSFNPSRWLSETQSAADEDKARPALTPQARALMEIAFKPFNAGPRMCIGLNLAWANMYHILAALIRRFELELYETDRRRDVDMVRDQFVSKPGKGSRGVRVSVVGEAE